MPALLLWCPTLSSYVASVLVLRSCDVFSLRLGTVIIELKSGGAHSIVTVLLRSALSLALGGVVSVVASGGKCGFGTVDQLVRYGAVGAHIDHEEAATEFDINRNWHFVMQITTSKEYT